MCWWNSDKRKKGDGKLQHPADAHQWKKFDEQYYLKFGKDSRNVRFALSTDGMNPFNEMTCTHSTWPEILMMYNLPTWLCQKRKYLLLSILIQEMETLWTKGIDIVDGFTRQTLNLRAIIFFTIHDYQALFILSGQIKGSTGYTVCVDDTVLFIHLLQVLPVLGVS
jgi:hypothetical protein